MSPKTHLVMTSHLRPVAARHLLPLEMALAAIATVPLGLNMLFGAGPLWQLVHRLGDQNSYTGNLVWGGAFILPGFVLLVAAYTEWMVGRRWPSRKMARSVGIRFWCSTVLLLANLSLLMLMVSEGAVGSAPGAVMTATMAIPFHVWVAWKTRRLAAVYNPDIPTARLQETIAAERW